MRRLSRSVLPELPPSVRQPHYDRERLKIGMAHIGVGAFHRCHQAEFIDDMLEARFGRWGVLGVNLTTPSLAELLTPQDCLYSRTLRQDAHAETRIIGALREVIDVTDKTSAEAAIAALGDPEICVATITVTEKGYCLTPSTGSSSSTILRCAGISKAACRPARFWGCWLLRSTGGGRPMGRR